MIAMSLAHAAQMRRRSKKTKPTKISGQTVPSASRNVSSGFATGSNEKWAEFFRLIRLLAWGGPDKSGVIEEFC